ncbi:MAG: sulfotransferase domain-containing protein, partial [Saprospiraceae bacterium]|nr:sulfotransferase domain-containing protein [Saprospiraceae bacterium]
MIWLASFPRSGNTFFRNVLYEVYGMESSTYHIDPGRKLDQNYDQYPIVKTHLLPHELDPANANIPAVYLVRDGRDALVSLAHHRKDIVEPGSDYEHNLLEAVIARGGSHFGGWSENVRAWLERADIVIRFEDLIQDPIQEAEKLRNIIELPKPRTDRLPDFEKLKHGQPKYGGGASSQFDPQKAKRHFRKGMIGSYQDEMPVGVQKLF